MNSPLSLADPALKSLVHWLNLGGVQTETADTVRQWFTDTTPFPETASAAAPSPRTMAPAPALEIDIKFNNINELNEFLRQWKRLGLSKTATHTVVGTGQTSSPRLMVICDAPDMFEDQKGEAFIGTGNTLIKEALVHAGFPLDTLYMTYLSKWRPPGQKALSPTEISILSPFLHQEIGFIRPQAILALGESTLKGLGLDSARPTGGAGEISLYKNQYLNYNLPLLTSQKGEFLVKTAGMKRNFWLSIVAFAASLRAKDNLPGSPSVNYTE